MDNFEKSLIIAALLAICGLAFLIKNMNTVISDCPGLVLQAPSGWVCTNVQKMVTK